MKANVAIGFLVPAMCVSLQAQNVPPTGASAALPAITNAVPGTWQIGVRNACSTEHLVTQLVTNAATQQVSTRTHRYLSVSSGENYLDASGAWQPSQDLIELMADGSAAALHGPCKAYFSPNLNVSGALSFVSRSNRVFSTHLLCLAYFSPSTGQRAMFAQIRDCAAELLPPNQIVWPSAFSIADVRVTFTKSAIETDVILTHQPPQPPEYYGISSSGGVRLEIWHEYIAPPTPQIKSRVLQSVTDPTLRSNMVQPDLVDQTLDFGDLWYPMGRVYSLDEYASAQTNGPAKIELANPAKDPTQIPVAKTWTKSADGTRTFLIESVPLANIAPLLSRLPPAGQGANLSTPKQQFAARPFPPPALKKTAQRPARPIQIATAAYRPSGCCIDYITVSGNGDYEFQPASYGTYFVSDGYFGGTVTFDPNCVVKSDGSYLLVYGPVVCNGSSGSPSILTSKNDDVFGEQLPEQSPTYNTHNPSASGTALWLYYNNNVSTVAGLKIRWANTGVQWDGSSSGGTITNCAFELSNTGAYLDGVYSTDFENVTVCGVTTPVNDSTGSYTGTYTDICAGQSDSGMARQWEIQYFGYFGVDPNGDPDGDGLSNLQEYLLGTNPKKAAVLDTAGAINLQLYTPLK